MNFIETKLWTNIDQIKNKSLNTALHRDAKKETEHWFNRENVTLNNEIFPVKSAQSLFCVTVKWCI